MGIRTSILECTLSGITLSLSLNLPISLSPPFNSLEKDEHDETSSRFHRFQSDCFIHVVFTSEELHFWNPNADIDNKFLPSWLWFCLNGRMGFINYAPSTNYGCERACPCSNVVQSTASQIIQAQSTTAISGQVMRSTLSPANLRHSAILPVLDELVSSAFAFITVEGDFCDTTGPTTLCCSTPSLCCECGHYQRSPNNESEVVETWKPTDSTSTYNGQWRFGSRREQTNIPYIAILSLC